MLTRRTALGALGLVPLSVPLWSGEASAQERYPSQPVKLIVPFPAGGPTDLIGRLVARLLQDQLGASFIVENRTGAAGRSGSARSRSRSRTATRSRSAPAAPSSCCRT
ncbi:hypothetical protein [Rhodoplanes elegans]|uniref:hypothetical protein n=1 Tax=Rhodoplanes elegans TaxID=29408 RepID=UPI001FCFC8B7|nr:hypothetical protein [Rhodoplanes elegans]